MENNNISFLSEDGENIELKELQNLLGLAIREGIMGNIDMDNVLKFIQSSYARMKKKKSNKY